MADDEGRRRPVDPRVHRGRGAGRNTANRFTQREIEPDLEEVTEGDVTVKTRYLDDTSKSVVATNDSPDVGFDASINPYRGCEHGCSYCLDGSTLILMSDGRSKPLSQVQVGDHIMGTEKVGHYRRLVQTTVLDRWTTVKSSYRILLQDETELIASGDHRFLTERGWRHVIDGATGARPHLTTNNSLLGWGDLAGLASRSSAELKVVSIEPWREEQELHDLTTGTGDFIANGVVSHNCYARPTHEYLGLSAGLDFERVILVKRDAAKLLEKRLDSPQWRPQALALSGVTDPYQPVERKLQITRSVLEVLARYRNPVALITKNSLVTRDLDVLSELAAWNGVSVTLSVTTLDEDLRARLEPRTATIANRLRAVRELAAAGVPVGVNLAPIIPGLTDHEIPDILAAAAEAGARYAGYGLVRLPGAVAELFEEWLEANAPLRKQRVLKRVREAHGGRLNASDFGRRMVGRGQHAEQVRLLFKLARQRSGIPEDSPPLNTAAFRRPREVRQGSLFGP